MVDYVNNRTANQRPRLYRPRRNAVYMNEQEARELLRRIDRVNDTEIVYDVETKEEE